jgi:hypothetical protein
MLGQNELQNLTCLKFSQGIYFEQIVERTRTFMIGKLSRKWFVVEKSTY